MSPVTEEQLREMLVEVTLALCRCAPRKLDGDAQRHLVDVFGRTVEPAVRQNGLEWWEAEGRAYATGRFCQVGRELGKTNVEAPVTPGELEDAVWAVTERTQEAMRRLVSRGKIDEKELEELRERAGAADDDEPDEDWLVLRGVMCPQSRTDV